MSIEACLERIEELNPRLNALTRTLEPTSPTARWPAWPSASRRTSTSQAPRRRSASAATSLTRPTTRRTSPTCAPPARCRSRAATSPTSRCAGTPRARGTARPSTRSTRLSARAGAAAATPSRSRPGWWPSPSAATTAARCACRRRSPASMRSVRPRAGSRWPRPLRRACRASCSPPTACSRRSVEDARAARADHGPARRPRPALHACGVARAGAARSTSRSSPASRSTPDPPKRCAAPRRRCEGHRLHETPVPHLEELAQLWIDLLAYDAGAAALPVHPRARLRRCADRPRGPARDRPRRSTARPTPKGSPRRHVLAADWSQFFARTPVLVAPVQHARSVARRPRPRETRATSGGASASPSPPARSGVPGVAVPARPRRRRPPARRAAPRRPLAGADASSASHGT